MGSRREIRGRLALQLIMTSLVVMVWRDAFVSGGGVGRGREAMVMVMLVLVFDEK